MPIIANKANQTKEVVVTAPVAVTTTSKPMQTYVDKVPITAKMRSYTLKAGQLADLAVTFQNLAGQAYNLTDIAITQFEVEIHESVSNARVQNGIASYPGTTTEEIATNKANGLLSIRILPEITRIAGIYTMVIKLYDTTTKANLIHTNECILYIANPLAQNASGPPSILEIRLQLRDSSPDENSLLDGFNFTDEELAIATIRPIQYFNETDPNIGIYYNTHNFPSRYYWTEGIIGQLFRIVAEYHRKNNLQYNSGGLSVDDRNKEQNYTQAGEMHWQLFVDWTKRQKVKINIENGYGVINSFYAYRY